MCRDGMKYRFRHTVGDTYMPYVLKGFRQIVKSISRVNSIIKIEKQKALKWTYFLWMWIVYSKVDRQTIKPKLRGRLLNTYPGKHLWVSLTLRSLPIEHWNHRGSYLVRAITRTENLPSKWYKWLLPGWKRLPTINFDGRKCYMIN